MIYDCCTFFNEYDLLDVRLNVLSKVVDKFVIVEANKTFSGMSKPFNFENNKKMFENFLDDIIYIKVEDMPKSDDYWEREYFQRNQIVKGLVNLNDDDIIIISDCDEIPDPSMITSNIDDNKIYMFQQKLFYYYFNLQSFNFQQIPTYTHGTAFLKYKYLRTITPQVVRNIVAKEYHKCYALDGGWHFSFINSIDNIKNKIESFSHKEYSNPLVINNLENKVRNLEDIFDRNYIYHIISNDILPQYIVNNKKFKKYFLEENIEKQKYGIIKDTENNYNYATQFSSLKNLFIDDDKGKISDKWELYINGAK